MPMPGICSRNLAQTQTQFEGADGILILHESFAVDVPG